MTTCEPNIKKSYIDILFEGKNKAYGAYPLRQNYNKRMGKAVIIGVTLLSTVLFLSAAFSSRTYTPTRYVPVVGPDVLNEYIKPEPIIPEPEIETASPDPGTTIKYVAPVIVLDNLVPTSSEMPTKDILEESNISDKTHKGNGETDLNPLSQTGNGSGFRQNDESTIIKTEVDVNKIWAVVEQEAIYPGGERDLLADVSRGFEFPTIAREIGVQGTIIVEFVVEKDGKASHINVVRGLGYGLDEAAVKAVKSIKRFKPAIQNGKPVRYAYSVPIRCNLN